MMRRILTVTFLGLAVALAALMLASPVHAQDLAPDPGAPPEAEPAVVEPAPALASPAQEAPPPEAGEALADAVPAPAEPAQAEPVDEAPPVEAMELAPGSEAAPAEEQAPAETVEAPALEALAGTGVVLADESGAALPLASGGDPSFTVGATTYRFYQAVGACGGAPNCWDGLAFPITAAIDKVWQAGLIPNDRKIYVEAGTYNEAISIDSVAHAPLAQLMGLVGGVAATTDPTGVGDPDRIINGNVYIRGMALGFTLEGFQINGNLYMESINGAATLKNLVVRGNTAGDWAVRVIAASGGVTVDHVDVSNNVYGGMWISNSGKFGPISITNSRFDDNDPVIEDWPGLMVHSAGSITINGISASGNGGPGAMLLSSGSSVTVRNSAFNDNFTNLGLPNGYAQGLYVESLTLTTVDNVVASGNWSSGILAQSKNSVTLSNIMADFNGLDGISVGEPVDELDPWGGWTDFASVVTLTNIDADENGRFGLLVRSTSSITVNNIDNFDNGTAGADLDNCLNNGSPSCSGMGNVILNNGTFYGNGAQDYGLSVSARGSILATNIQAGGNNDYGAALDNWWTGAYGVVSLSGLPAVNSRFNGNGDQGLIATSTQGVTLNYIEASNNGLVGVHVDNSFPGSMGAVTVSDSNFYQNQEEGLYVDSNGAVSIYRCSANENGQAGNKNGMYIRNDGAAYPMPVTVYNAGFWDNPSGSGLEIDSKGFIYLYGVSAGRNDANGLDLNNAVVGSYSGVSILGASTSPLNPYSDFYQNNNSGVRIISNGAVSVSNANINENDLTGLYINTGTSVYGSATLTNVYADNNGNNGVLVSTFGAVTWTNGRANNNGWQGGYNSVEIDNEGAAYAMPVTLTGIEIHGSNQDGLIVFSKGAITLGNATIQDNPGRGARLQNGAGTVSMVNIYNANLSNNGGLGLEVDSRGYILLSSTNANNCGGGGMDLDNSTSAYYVGVTFTQGRTGNNRNADGLDIYSKGYVTLVDVSSYNNEGYGAYINNSTGIAAGLTFIGGYYGNVFNNNANSGLTILASGPVTIFNLDASDNKDQGMFINNEAGASGPVTIYGTLPRWTNGYSYNGSTGLMVNSKSAITLFNVAAEGNGLGGAHLDNLAASYPYGVSVTNGWFNENQNGDGIAVYSKGAVTLNYIDAERNSVDWNGQANVGETYHDHMPSWDSDGDSWWFYADGATPITIAMDELSGGMDPYLFLWDENDNLVAQDDDGGGYPNSLITAGVLAAGMYRIQATQFGDREDSEYLLAINDPGKGLDRIPANNIHVVNNSGSGAVSINGLYNDWVYSNNAAGSGISVETNGGVNMNYVESNTNGIFGIVVSDNSSLYSSWTNIRADDNPQDGVNIWSRGTYFYLYKGEFNNNDGRGFILDDTGGTGVSITTLANVMTNNNGSDGLYAYTRGPQTLMNIESYENGAMGANIDNRTGTGMGYVYILGQANAFSNNVGNNLQIYSKGSVMLMNTTADRSQTGNGADIYNHEGTGFVIINGAYAYPGWYSSFSDNAAGSGLNITSKGLVSLYNVRALNNGIAGASVVNSGATLAPSPITITQSQFSDNHGGNGLSAYSRGLITLTSVRAEGNQNTGAVVDNSGAPWLAAPQGVTVINSLFQGNQNGSGLWATSYGSILGYTVIANYNANYGAYLDNRYGPATGTISLYGSYGENTFTGNGMSGVFVKSYKAVTLYNLASQENQSHGTEIFNTTTDASAPVNVMLSRFNGNVDNGLYIETNKPVTLSFLSAISNGNNGNDRDGIFVMSQGGNVSLSYSTLTGNFGNGIEVAHGAGIFTQFMNNYLGNDRNMNQAPDSLDNVNSHF